MNKKQQTLSKWQRFRQYQPTSRLVKWLLFWWMLVVLATAIGLTDGFGITSPLERTTAELTAGALFFCQLLLGLLVLISALDVLLLRAISQANNYHLQRDYPNNVAIFHPLGIKIVLSFIADDRGGLAKTLVNKFIKSIQLEFFDDYPSQFTLVQSMPISLAINLAEPFALSSALYSNDSNVHVNNGNSDQTKETTKEDTKIAQTFSKQIVYPVQPTERGTGYFGMSSLRVTSPFGLFRRQLQIAQTDDKHDSKQYLRVLADFTGLLSNELSAVFEKSFDAGIQTIKEQGQGSEFLKLREYAVGDSMRQIDWKASSRQGRIMSKSYEDENDQDVIFLLDCSEQMRHKEPPQHLFDGTDKTDMTLSYFDKVLNAVLLLAYIANKQGDKVGLMTFGGVSESEKFIAPKKGVSLIRHLLNETADIMPTMQTSDYFKAAEALNKSIKKRSLVIVITNTRQEASSELLQAMHMLSRQHQLVFANLTEDSVQEVVNQKTLPVSVDDALLYHSLVSYKQTREKLHKKLRQQTGAMCLATTANKLPTVLTQAYLSIRNK